MALRAAFFGVGEPGTEFSHVECGTGFAVLIEVTCLAETLTGVYGLLQRCGFGRTVVTVCRLKLSNILTSRTACTGRTARQPAVLATRTVNA
jgi:hypothetical protein